MAASGPHHGWQRLVRSFGALAGGESAARAVGFVAVVLMARRLGPGAFGIVVLGTTMVNWFRLVVDAGTEMIGVRDSARRPERFRELVEPILGLRLAIALGAAVVFVLAAAAAAKSANDREALALFALVLPMISINPRFMVVGVRGAKSVAVGNVVCQLLITAGVVLLVRDRHDLALVPLLQAAGELLYAAVVLVAVVRRLGWVRPRILPPVWRATLRAGAPIAANNLARTVMYSFDVFLIAVVLSRHDVGLYGAAYKPILFFSTIVGLFGVSFLAAYSAPESTGRRYSLTRRTALATCLVAVPGAVLASAGAGVGLKLVYGSAYADAATALALLAWTIPVLAFAVPFAQILIARDRQAVLMRHNVAGALFNVAGNLAAIPLFGLAGAAAMTLASFVLVLVLNYRSAVRLGLAESVGVMARRWRRGGMPPAALAETER